jgi:Predicted GTPases
LIEKYSVSSTFDEIKKSDVCVLLIDANENINKQDLLISKKVLEYGKGLILVLNKWDTIKNKLEKKNVFLARIKKSLSQIREINLNTISAISGDGVSRLLNEISLIHNRFDNRIETNILNKFFKNIVDKNPPSLVNGKKNALKYITQFKSKPPIFILFCTFPKKISKSYIRYIENSLREYYDFRGMPIKILLRKSTNPYSNK